MVIGAASAAFFFFVGISAFRALEAAALATAAVLSFGLGFALEAGFVAVTAMRRRAADLTLDFAFGVDRAATLAVGAVFAFLADGFLAGPTADATVFELLTRSAVPDVFAFAEVPDFASTFLGLEPPTLLCEAGPERVLVGRSVLGGRTLLDDGRTLLADRAEDVSDFADARAFGAAGFVEAVVLTAFRAFVRLALDLASLADLPRGAAAAFAFGGMADHSSWRGRSMNSSAAHRARERP